jgi:hypothetical protein
MTDSRNFWRGVVVGILLMSAIAIGILQLQDGRAREEQTANDRRADSLQARLDAATAKSAADSVENARLAVVADSSSAAARRALTRSRPSFVSHPDPSAPAPGDTVKRALVMRAVDPVPFSVPQFMVDELAQQERQLQYVMRAWQDSERARLFADSVYIPDLRRQLAESGEVIRAERDRVADRDRALARKDRQLAIEKGKTKIAGVLLLIVGGIAIAR